MGNKDNKSDLYDSLILEGQNLNTMIKNLKLKFNLSEDEELKLHILQQQYANVEMRMNKLMNGG